MTVIVESVAINQDLHIVIRVAICSIYVLVCIYCESKGVNRIVLLDAF